MHSSTKEYTVKFCVDIKGLYWGDQCPQKSSSSFGNIFFVYFLCICV